MQFWLKNFLLELIHSYCDLCARFSNNRLLLLCFLSFICILLDLSLIIIKITPFEPLLSLLNIILIHIIENILFKDVIRFLLYWYFVFLAIWDKVQEDKFIKALFLLFFKLFFKLLWDFVLLILLLFFKLLLFLEELFV